MFSVDPCRVIWGKVKIQRTIEQQYTIKFCIALGKLDTETLGMIHQVFKDESMTQTTVKCKKIFIDGRKSVEDEPRAGQPST